MNYDFAVVGDGPAGSYAAKNASKEHDVALVGRGPKRMQCAGLISSSGLERIGVKPGDWVINKIRGARIFSPNGVELLVDGGKTKAYAVDRIAFDRHLIDAASDAGAEYVQDWVSSLKGGINLKSGATIKSTKTILASGTDYSLQREMGFDAPTEFLIGGQYEMNIECDPDFVELYFNVPDFFSWIIPVGDMARVGLCTKSNPRPHLDRFVKKLKQSGKIKSDKVLSESFGIIPVHNPKTKTQFGDVLTVGDAAGQVKASTGGGIILGCVAAQHATHPDYEQRWRAEIGSELRLHLMIHRFLNRLSDSGKDRFLGVVADCTKSLQSSGDMDMASKTIYALLKNPRFLKGMISNAPQIIKDII